ncbi:helix-turn-helix transcriptional regulator [Gilvimarinus polysaccharolyticus]|uniref:helix-turn-helix transcriptional regulator n=1 Tax=Gilvimarinus polysaccharolyticus TaxID=863921 RepID=UPI0006736648|nr:helix-turn-helix transcriptional regulator [Gilvimarinus polysaccharolyticus]
MQKTNSYAATGGSVDSVQLRQHIAPIAREHRLQGESHGTLLQGHIFSWRFGAGMTMHCVDAHERQDCVSSSECPAGISINILLAGRVRFSLGPHQYDCAADDQAQGLGLRLAECEVFTRQLRRDAYTCKVNVSLSAAWLRDRFAGSLPYINAPTPEPQAVVSWQPSDAQVQLAHRMLDLSVQAKLDGNHRALLALEAAAIELTALVLNGNAEATPLTRSVTDTAAESLRQLLERDIAGTFDLPVLARRAGMSVSTLQRRFKSESGMTVMEYVRRRKLEIARNALVLEGRSIQEAAYLAGYEHSSNFIKAFKQRFGITPANLVRQHGAGA